MSECPASTEAHCNVMIQVELKQGSPPDRKTQSYVPFLLKSKRFQDKNNHASPPVGVYETKSCFDHRYTYHDKRLQEWLECAEKHRKEMCVFKSSQHRFKEEIVNAPGPTSYNLSNSITAKCQRHLHETLSRAQNAPKRSCPSIPNYTNKYGYSYNGGEVIIIQKSSEKIECEKVARKNYIQTLEGEQKCRRNSPVKYSAQYYQHKKKMEKVSQNLIAKFSIEENKHESQIKHICTSSSKRQKFTPAHLTQNEEKPLKQQQKNNVGPGSYDVTVGSFVQKRRNEEFQFFGSSQVRFKESNQNETNQKQNGQFFFQTRQKREQGKKGFLIKKKLQKETVEGRKKILFLEPGPGEYEPCCDITKKARGVPIFPSEERFKQPQETYVVHDRAAQFGVDPVFTAPTKMRTTGTLRKDQLKSFQNSFEPAEPKEIHGIGNTIKEEIKKIVPSKSKGKSQQRQANFGSTRSRFHLSRLEATEDQSLCSWQKERPSSQRSIKKAAQPSNVPNGSYIAPFKQKVNKVDNSPGPGTYDPPKVSKKKAFNINFYK